MTPNEIIASYIRELPPAIRPDVCFLLLGCLSDCRIDSETDLEKEALDMICPKQPDYEIRAALCVSAYLDYLFATGWRQKGDTNIAIFHRLAEETDNEIWKTAAMRQPLTDKYREVARLRWAELRRNELTHDKIAAHERILEMRQIGILEPTI